MICLTPRLYSCSISSHMINKMADFCYEKVFVRLLVQFRNIWEKQISAL